MNTRKRHSIRVKANFDLIGQVDITDIKNILYDLAFRRRPFRLTANQLLHVYLSPIIRQMSKLQICRFNYIKKI